MTLRISTSLTDKAATFPESSYGSCNVTLVLRSGETISDVVLAWGSEIVKVGGKSIASEAELPFRLSEIVDALPS